MSCDLTSSQIAIGNYIAQADHGSTAIVNVYEYVAARPVDDATLAAAQHRFATLPLNEIPDVAPLPQGSRMPFTVNPLFVGRAHEFTALAVALRGGTTTAIAAATGLGGIGKTQLAIEFAHRYGQFFAGSVFWISCGDPQGIAAEIAACGGAGHLDLRPDFASLSINDQVRLVLGAWQSPLPRLLIFDNCEDIMLLATWHPPTGGCRVLVTSRRAEWDPALGVETLPLDALPRAESIALLRRFRAELPSDDTQLDAIAAEIGDLPLALHMAGSFLRTYRHAAFGSPKAYLAQLRQASILDHPSLTGEGATFSPTGHQQHIGQTFGLSYCQLNPADPTDGQAIALLLRVAYFAPGEVIPRDLLMATLRQPDADFTTTRRSEKALLRLVGLGLVEEEGEGALRMHRLEVAFARALESDFTAQFSVEDTLLDTLRQFDQSGNVVEARRFETHIRAVTDHAIRRGDERAADLCHFFGNHLRRAADYSSAQYYLDRALAIRESFLRRDHPETALDLNDLGLILYLQGNHAGARPYLERALALWEEKRDFPQKAATLDNLAQLLAEQGDSTGAYDYYRAALEIREQVLGPAHPDTAITLNNLGSLMVLQGNLVSAREYHERALEIRDKIFKEPNHNTAASLTNLAGVLARQGDLPRAQECFERALAIRDQILGPIHPRTLNTLSGLVYVLCQLGDSGRARSYLDRLSVLSNQLGGNDPNTLNNLGYALWAIGDYVAALCYYKEALATLECRHGKLHAALSVTLNNVGMALVPLGDYTAARLHYERALQIQEQLGKDGEDLTSRILNNFGVLLLLQGELGRARACLERALELRTQMLGEMHRDTAASLNNLGLLFQAEGDAVGAQRFIERALLIAEQRLGNSHPDVARSLHDLGALFQAQGKVSEARTYLKRALAIREQALPDHPDIAATLMNLGILAQGQGDMVEARSYLERALTVDEQRLGTDHPTTRTIRERLAALSACPQ